MAAPLPPPPNPTDNHNLWSKFYDDGQDAQDIDGQELEVFFRAGNPPNEVPWAWHVCPDSHVTPERGHYNRQIVRVVSKGLPWGIWNRHDSRLSGDATCTLDGILVACKLLNVFAGYTIHPAPAFRDPSDANYIPNNDKLIPYSEDDLILDLIPFLVQESLETWGTDWDGIGDGVHNDPADWAGHNKNNLRKLKRDLWCAVVAKEELKIPRGTREHISPCRGLEYCLKGEMTKTLKSFPARAHYCRPCDIYYEVKAGRRRELNRNSGRSDYQKDNITLIRTEAAWANNGNHRATTSMQRLIEGWFQEGGDMIPPNIPDNDILCPVCNGVPSRRLSQVLDKTHEPSHIAVAVPIGWWDQNARARFVTEAAASFPVVYPVNNTHRQGPQRGQLTKKIRQYRWQGALYLYEHHMRLYWRDPKEGPNGEDQLLMYDSACPTKPGRPYNPTCLGPIIGGIPEVLHDNNTNKNNPNNIKVHPLWHLDPVIIFYELVDPGKNPTALIRRELARRVNVTNRNPGANLKNPKPPRRDAATPQYMEGSWRDQNGTCDFLVGKVFQYPLFHGDADDNQVTADDDAVVDNEAVEKNIPTSPKYPVPEALQAFERIVRGFAKADNKKKRRRTDTGNDTLSKKQRNKVPT